VRLRPIRRSQAGRASLRAEAAGGPEARSRRVSDRNRAEASRRLTNGPICRRPRRVLPRACYTSSMLVVLFRSKLVPAPDGYAEMAQEMLDTARSMPGFVDVKAYTSADGERLTVVWWEDEDTLRAWRTHARHLAAQKAGRERWYEYYDLEVAEVIRRRQFARPDAVTAR